MPSTKLTRSVTTTGNQRTWTISVWVKRSKLGTSQYIFSAKNVGETTLHFRGEDDLQLELYDGNNYYIRTNRLFRDTNAWYHIVAIWDSIRPTASDRMRLYVNGVQETSFSATVYPPQNYDSYVNQSGETNLIGTYAPASVPSFDGSMSHFHLIDGNDYNASYFGETDATTGEWKIKTDVSVTYGTNGFFILKDGNSVTDQSGNGNNFTVAGGTLTNTEDSPSNVFATGNPLHKGNELGAATFSNGNNTHNGTTSGASYPYTFSTLAASQGKWYAEFKKIDGDTMIGIGSGISDSFFGGTASAYGYGMYPTGDVFTSGSGNSYGDAISNNDIIGVAMDLDNSKCYWSKNGVWQNSGDPESGATGTGAFSIQSTTSNTTGVYHFAYGKAGNTVTDIEANFGNGYFGTTAVSSAGTNASGIGIFEYDVPTGYTALSTKGLNL